MGGLPVKIPLLCAKAVLQLLAGCLPQTARCSRFFHTLWHLLKAKEESNGCVIESAFSELHCLWRTKLFESIPRLIVGDQTLRHRVVSRFGKE